MASTAMSRRQGEAAPAGSAAVLGRIERYYTRYYREVLGIPGWEELVQVRLADAAYEDQHVARLEGALGRPLRGLRLLNVGCGTGGFNAAAERRGAIGWGVDLDPEAVAIASRRAPDGRIVRGPAESLPFRSGAFDVVYCFSTLEHVADAGEAVREMVRVLRPEGVLYLHTPSRWSCFESHYKLFWIPGLSGWPGRAYLAARGRPTAFLGTLRLLTLGECTRMLVSAGIRTVRVIEGHAKREAGGRLWPLVRLYYGLFRVQPYVELVAVR